MQETILCWAPRLATWRPYTELTPTGRLSVLCIKSEVSCTTRDTLSTEAGRIRHRIYTYQLTNVDMSWSQAAWRWRHRHPRKLEQPGLPFGYPRLNSRHHRRRLVSDDSQILEGPSFGHKSPSPLAVPDAGKTGRLAVFSRRSFEANPHGGSSSIDSQSACRRADVVQC